MTRISSYIAIAFGVFLAVAEAYRNWGDWQWWPWWLIDYVGAGLLIIGATMALKAKGRVWLAGAWGYTVSMFWSSYFGHVENLQQGAQNAYGPDGSVSEERLTVAILIMLVTAHTGFVMALFGKDKS